MGWWKARSFCSIRSSSSTWSRHFLVLKNNRNVILIQLSKWFVYLKKIISMSRPSWYSCAVLCNKMHSRTQLQGYDVIIAALHDPVKTFNMFCYFGTDVQPQRNEGSSKLCHNIIECDKLRCKGDEANENKMKWGGFIRLTVHHKEDYKYFYCVLLCLSNQQPSQVITLPLNQYYCQHCVVCNK